MGSSGGRYNMGSTGGYRFLFLLLVLFPAMSFVVGPQQHHQHHRRATPLQSSSSALLQLFEADRTPLDEALCPPSVQALTKQCLVACVYLDRDEEPISREDLLEPSIRLNEILQRCSEVAPRLTATDTYVLPLARLAAWTERDQWQRPLSEWTPESDEKDLDEDDAGQAALRSLAAHLVEKWSDVPETLRWALGYVDGPPATEACQLISHRFFSIYQGAAGGTESAKDGLQRITSPKFSKQMAKLFVQGDTAASIEDKNAIATAAAAAAAAAAAVATEEEKEEDREEGAEGAESGSSSTALKGEYEEVMRIFGMSGRQRSSSSSSSSSAASPSSLAKAKRAARPSPLRLLRHAQVSALVNSASNNNNVVVVVDEEEEEEEEEESERVAWLLDAVLASKSGGALSTGAGEEEFLQSAVQWAVTHADELQEPSTVTTALNYLCEMAAIEGTTDDGKTKKFSCAGRTPKSVKSALEAYELSSVTFDGDEMFQPNPVGIQGLFRTDATIPKGTKVYVPYDGEHELGGSGGLGGPLGGYMGDAMAGAMLLGKRPDRTGAAPVTVRILEIDSLKRLVFEGQQLGNCLENKLHSQVKYVSRVRQRSSSYWSLTILRADGTLDYECLIEVWHLRRGNVIHQAEGPRPRTIPTPEAWYWLQTWCDEQNLDLTNWNCYS